MKWFGVALMLVMLLFCTGCLGEDLLSRVRPECVECAECAACNCSTDYLLTIDSDLRVEVNWPSSWLKRSIEDPDWHE